MKRFAAFAVAVAAALAGASPAGAQEHIGDVKALGPVQVRGDEARVHVRYSCDAGDHLWVSVKQTANGQKTDAVAGEGAGFGGVAASWYHSHRDTVTCDGKRHVGWFTIDKLEPGSRGQLRDGYGWLQFCVTSGEMDLTVSLADWVRVRTF